MTSISSQQEHDQEVICTEINYITIQFNPTFRDRYASMSELYLNEPEHKYAVSASDRGSMLLFIAPHGGNLEPGTSELLSHLVSNRFSYYDFRGQTVSFDPDLHVASTRFDCPKLTELLRKSQYAVSIHGCIDPGDVVFLGGKDTKSKTKLTELLIDAGIEVRDHPLHRGLAANNICNQARLGKGLQIELAKGLQAKLSENINEPKIIALVEILTQYFSLLEQELYAEFGC